MLIFMKKPLIRYSILLMLVFATLILVGCYETTILYNVQEAEEFNGSNFNITLLDINYSNENETVIFDYEFTPISDNKDVDIRFSSFIILINDYRYGIGAPFENCNQNPNEGDHYYFRVDGSVVDINQFSFNINEINNFSLVVKLNPILNLYNAADILENLVDPSLASVTLDIDSYQITFGNIGIH